MAWLNSVFNITPKERNEIVTHFFEHGQIPTTKIRRDMFSIAHSKLSNLVDDNIVFSIATEGEAVITIVHGDENASSNFKIRRIDDETAYISNFGIVMTVSDRRKRKGRHIHETRLSFTSTDAIDLSSEATRKFIRLLNPKAKLIKDGEPWIDISCWTNLENLGSSIRALETVFLYLNKDFSGIYLQDALDEEAMNTTALLEALINKAHNGQIIPGFIIGPSAEQGIEDSDPRWHKGKYRIPVVANLHGQGIVVWLDGDCIVFIDNGFVCGFRPTNIQSWEHEIHDRRFKKSINPEAWVQKDLPAIKLTSANTEQITFSGGLKHELGGDVWLTD